MNWFVRKDSIVREIWGTADTTLFIFAGASAEFALNKSVDWLYFTGKLPADPLGRLFSTVAYAREILFAERGAAFNAIDKIASIHAGVENKRGARIPDSAYRDVLFMLIDYSIRSFELLERTLTTAEKKEVFEVFYQVGSRMGIVGLPKNLEEWLVMRESHLAENLIKSDFSTDLYRQYKKHLGLFRYLLLMEVQARLVPEAVRKLLKLRRRSAVEVILPVYKFLRIFSLHKILRNAILPVDYKSQVLALEG